MTTGRIFVASRTFVLGAYFALFGLAGCGDDDEDSAEDDGELDCAESMGPPGACCAVMQSILDACIRCDVGGPALCELAVEQQLDVVSFGAGCPGADQVRDENELYQQCLPGMEALDCASFKAGVVPASCQDQITYRIN